MAKKGIKEKETSGNTEESKRNLEQTKSYFKFEGIVEGINKDHAFKTGEIQSGKMKGKSYNSVRFQIKTSETNKLNVELFGCEQDFVYPYKKGEKGKSGDTMKLKFSKRNELPKGYNIIGVNVQLEEDESGKLIRKSMVDFDAAEYIYQELENGTSVRVTGEIQKNSYEKNGERYESIKYIIKSIKKIDDIDFEDKNFKEINSFSQEIVFVDSDYEEEAIYINAYTIQYGNKFSNLQLVIRPNGNDKIKKFANKLTKKLKFGDFIELYGHCLNTVEIVRVDPNDDIDDDDDEDFEGERPDGLEDTFSNYIVELRVTGAKKGTFKQEVYEESDFVVDDLIEESDEDDEEDDDDFLNDEDEDDDDFFLDDEDDDEL
ncbi:hypothetical protein B7C51_24900 (plasmid) [Paenibacillus larvae subsp. pulvifaciens]|uniref:Uncharacterized protein n=1 Tax=Paenibacillus larvae subsp. pulvifaciens TaxID=1477 RepID=A0A1V0UZR3_9BACL|nr:hypothetical protein [Paenibacillus larvae]ARF70715.1 hypothetical protein B7C51_24900 [Paenibacillus larvae subsp. pulvifaciens]